MFLNIASLRLQAKPVLARALNLLFAGTGMTNT